MDVDVVVRLRGVITRLARQFNASATGEGLSPSQASALGLISYRGPMSLGDLADIEGLNPSMVSRVVGALDDAGLIIRQQNPKDLRTGLVEVTANGRSTIDRIKAERAKVISEYLDRLPEPDRVAIATALPALEALAGEFRN